MDYDNLDLRNKTILDFTDDESIITEIVGDKEFFLSHITEHWRAMSFIYYAEHIQDNKFINAVRKEFEPEFTAFHNE
jgi:hypothetical protein